MLYKSPHQGSARPFPSKPFRLRTPTDPSLQGCAPARPWEPFLTAVTREALLPLPRSPGPQGSVRIGLNHEGLLALPSLLHLKQPPLREREKGVWAGMGGLQPDQKTWVKGGLGQGASCVGGRVPGLQSLSNSFLRSRSPGSQAPPPPGPRSPALQNPCSLEILESHHQGLLLEIPNSYLLISQLQNLRLRENQRGPGVPEQVLGVGPLGRYGRWKSRGWQDSRAQYLLFQLLQPHGGKLIPQGPERGAGSQ